MYLEQCAACHGEDGDAVAGVDLRSGRLRRAALDRELIQVIRNGIPGTGMLAIDLDTAEMTGIVAYLRNMTYEVDVATLGDAGRGRAIFEGTGDCLSCHRLGGRGLRTGLDLTRIGAVRPLSALRRSLLDPTGTMRPIDRPVELVTADGARITGRRLNEGHLHGADSRRRGAPAVLRQGRPARIPGHRAVTDARLRGSSRCRTELADLLAYLVSLKG